MLQTTDQDLVRMLATVRLRLLLRRVIQVLPWSLALGAVFFGAATIVGEPTGTAVMLGLGTFAFGILAALAVWQAARPLTRQRLARLVDHRLGLQERFSTALEVAPTASVVAAALHMDAGARAVGLDASSVAPLRVPVVGVAVLLAAMAFGALSPAVTNPGVTNSSELTDLRVTPDELATLAGYAADRAEEREDQHLAAVAGALQELAAEATERQEAYVSNRERLGELLTALDRITAPAGFLGDRSAVASTLDPSSDAEIADLVRALERRLAPLPVGMSDPDVFDVETTWLPGDLARPEPVLGEGGATNRPEGRVEASYVPADSMNGQPSQISEGTTTQIESAAIIGASKDATAGASEFAGMGSQDLFGEASLVATPEATDTVALLGEESDEGRRVAVELSPDATGAQGSAGAGVVGDWRHAELPEIALNDLPYAYRRVAGDYFLPSQETVSR